MTISVSVVIPTHNRTETLPRALDSVLEQTVAPNEIIVVDDGSTDDTARLINENYPQIRYLHQENSGVSAARNHGIRKARGDWIALLDSDDAWLGEKLSAQLALIKANPAYRLCHTEEIWVRNGVRVNQMKKHAKSGGEIFSKCLPMCVISPSSAMIHRSLFEEVGLFDESLPACEDYDLWLRICAREAVLYDETPRIIKYGGHEDQLSRRYWGMDRFRIRALEKIVNDDCIETEYREKARKALLKKTAILGKGARKHNNRETLAVCAELERRYGDSVAIDQ